jgi:hypothetical protein
MLETLFILASAGSALKVTGWIFLGIIAFYATIIAIDHFCGLEGIIKFFGTIWALFCIAIFFGVVFLVVLGIQALAGV